MISRLTMWSWNHESGSSFRIIWKLQQRMKVRHCSLPKQKSCGSRRHRDQNFRFCGKGSGANARTRCCFVSSGSREGYATEAKERIATGESWHISYSFQHVDRSREEFRESGKGNVIFSGWFTDGMQKTMRQMMSDEYLAWRQGIIILKMSAEEIAFKKFIENL